MDKMTTQRSLTEILQEYRVPYVLPGEHRHCTEGWVNVNCPHCQSRNYHLGISVDGRGCHCWRCGRLPVTSTLAEVLGVSVAEARRLLQRLKSTPVPEAPTRAPRVKAFKFPPHSDLDTRGRRYLEQRGFDSEKIAYLWELKQTLPIARLDGVDYGNRLLIPIIWEGQVVSFETRDITGRAELRYISCPKEREIIHHKDIVYAHPDAGQGKTLIVVEGVTDVWRLGRSAVATFGITFSLEQVLALAALHNRFAVLFDPEPQARRKAKELCVKLKALRRQAFFVDLSEMYHNINDPGDLPQDEADNLVRELGV